MKKNHEGKTPKEGVQIQSRLKALYIITNEGFTIYNQSFGATDPDQDMVGSLLAYRMRIDLAPYHFDSFRGWNEEDEREDEREGADMFLEQGDCVKAIVIVVLDEDNRERDEYLTRKQMRQFIHDIEEKYTEELTDPIFRMDSFSGLKKLVKTNFHHLLSGEV